MNETMSVQGLWTAEQFVAVQKSRGNDVRWDGWDMVFFRADPRAVWSADDGAWRNGRYGFEHRVVVNNDGAWEVDLRNVRLAKSSPRN